MKRSVWILVLVVALMGGCGFFAAQPSSEYDEAEAEFVEMLTEAEEVSGTIVRENTPLRNNSRENPLIDMSDTNNFPVWPNPGRVEFWRNVGWDYNDDFDDLYARVTIRITADNDGVMAGTNAVVTERMMNDDFTRVINQDRPLEIRINDVLVDMEDSLTILSDIIIWDIGTLPDKAELSYYIRIKSTATVGELYYPGEFADILYQNHLGNWCLQYSDTSILLFPGLPASHLTVSFDLNHDEGGLGWEQRVARGGLATEPAEPTRDGFEFVGWFTSRHIHGFFDFNTPVTRDIDLFAGWLPYDEDWQRIEYVYPRLRLGFQGADNWFSVTQNILMPDTSAFGANVRWRSSNSAVVSTNGIVNRPQHANAHVTLTAIIESGGKARNKDFQLEVMRSPGSPTNVIEFSEADLFAMNDGDRFFHEFLRFNEEGKLTHISGKFTNIPVHTPEDALAAVYSVRGLTGIVDPFNEFELTHVSNMLSGGRSYRFAQVFNGVRVQGHTLTITADENGVPDTLGTSYVPGISINTTPTISRAEAERIVRAELGNNLIFREAELFIRTPRPDDNRFRLNWELTGSHGFAYVDAHSGEFIGSHSSIISGPIG